MKMTQKHYDKLKSAMLTVVNINKGADAVNARYESYTRLRKLWDILHITTKQREGVTYNELYMYLNDSHIETALKRIGAELGL